jgi:hypothetical protein
VPVKVGKDAGQFEFKKPAAEIPPAPVEFPLARQGSLLPWWKFTYGRRVCFIVCRPEQRESLIRSG